jgi:suppressor for copper-sensitivity B
MVQVQRILGIALAGTALWLLSVVAASAGRLWALLALALAVAPVIVLGFGARKPEHRRWAAMMAAALIVALVAAPPLLLSRDADDAGAGNASPALWQPFDRAEIPALVAAGRIVVVDVTADWCVTCLVNKRLVLDQGEVAAALGRPEVAPRRADWTRPNDEIAKYLASFGRYGIPFNAIYGPGAPGGIVLPEVLTPDVVLAALRRAGSGP